MFHVQQIDHITMVVSDLATSVRFYTDVLGMQQVARPAFKFPGAWLQAGTTYIHMNVAGDEAGEAGPGVRGGQLISRGFHTAFRVDDFPAAEQRIRELGIPFAAGPQTRPDGARQLYIHDPDGHLLELFADAG